MTKDAPELPNMNRLLDIMAALRNPEGGCPWDLKQTMESLIPYTIEEAYEVAAAITEGNIENIRDELGDLIFQVVFYAQLAKEQGEFDFDGIAEAIADKLVRRHPHVFADGEVADAEDVKRQWELIKKQERADKATDRSVFADIPSNLPAILQALKIQKRCAAVGFDWDEPEQVLAKISEETQEVAEELSASERHQEKVEEEIGDLLFATVNLARHCKVNPETALRRANVKFMQRFREVERLAEEQQINLDNAGLARLESLWGTAKSNLKA
ncbi:nucleoside triphosphate pyrophosphohydrolase [Aliidiomarina iranensis]|uniref:Nucleoside triphosphate pyrophosphohydrolase n=1 Tax=Aliidiomarina iranensis TaxID=1434071 RepID=A0A432W0Y7_9GAMM|nr:nucleoside triphosphate pyrophosphohydrolase [Aliidiomarina iranensis]RUO22684.1 nucleoside triphosphate pyrophosphohydrolase [Aliidiomarina iranensis]